MAKKIFTILRSKILFNGYNFHLYFLLFFSRNDKMAAVNIKQEVHRVSPGQSSMAADSVDGIDKIGEKSFSALQGLIMAEDRRTKEKEVSCLQNVRKF